jgi:hypothetical protein
MMLPLLDVGIAVMLVEKQFEDTKTRVVWRALHSALCHATSSQISENGLANIGQ